MTFRNLIESIILPKEFYFKVNDIKELNHIIKKYNLEEMCGISLKNNKNYIKVKDKKIIGNFNDEMKDSYSDWKEIKF